MTEAGISFKEVDVDADHGYDERIMRANGGYRTVPTLEVDGTLLVNPTIHELKAALPPRAS
jgi:mycoredoxin